MGACVYKCVCLLHSKLVNLIDHVRFTYACVYMYVHSLVHAYVRVYLMQMTECTVHVHVYMYSMIAQHNCE